MEVTEDGLDGWVARKRNETSLFGALLGFVVGTSIHSRINDNGILIGMGMSLLGGLFGFGVMFLLYKLGEIVARVDAHSTLPEGYLQRAVATLLESGADNVGGMQVPIGTTGWEKAPDSLPGRTSASIQRSSKKRRAVPESVGENAS